MTHITLGELAQQVGGEYIGDASLEIQRVIHPAQANSAQDLALILDQAILPLLSQKTIQTALLPLDLSIDSIPNQIKVRRPKVALAKLLDIFDKPPYIPPGVHPSAVIDPTATIESGVVIGPLCTVGPNTVISAGTRLVSHVSIGADVSVGQNCLFYPGTVLGDRVVIGNRVILQANVSVGSDGYSYVTPEMGSVESARATGKIEAQNTAIIRINSVGTVVLEDDVEIGANSCIDRATLGETRIKKGTKLDNLVQIAHNVTVGENCLIVAQAGIAGSTKIGNRTVVGGQVGIADHVNVGEDCIIMAQSAIPSNLADKSFVVGSPAVPRKEFLYREMQVKRIKGLSQKIDALTERLNQLEVSQSVTEEQPV